MQVLIFTLSIFIFLHTLYKLVKDDHVFLRKNIKVEEIFDIAFIVTAIGLILAQIAAPKNITFLTFFVFGSSLSLLLIGKYKKFPLGRLFDFFTLSFLTALPILYLLESLLFKKIELIIYLISAFIYFSLAVYFNKILLKRVMSRTIKEGNLSVYFMIFFSILSLSTSIVRAIIEHGGFLNFENIILVFTFIVGLILLFT